MVVDWDEAAERWEEHSLNEVLSVYTTSLPAELRLGPSAFEELWEMRPGEQPIVILKGERRVAPRWHHAYGHDYSFAGHTSEASPVPAQLNPLLEWTRSTMDERLNGLLLNWYDAQFEHRIAQHRDVPDGRIEGCPIVTISLGAERTFQMVVRKRRVSIPVQDGSVVVIPDRTNKKYAHAVPHLPGDTGRRISVTIRGFA